VQVFALPLPQRAQNTLISAGHALISLLDAEMP
jgi:hypothetical protein